MKHPISAFLLFALAVAASVAHAIPVFIHTIGDETVEGGSRHSFRRSLYHLMVARGYEPYFVGSNNDCDGARFPDTWLDYDSHHDGYHGSPSLGVIASKLSSRTAAVHQSASVALNKAHNAGMRRKPHFVTIIVGGANDMLKGRTSRDVSEQDFFHIAKTSDGIASAMRGKFEKMSLVVAPTPPPGGRRAVGEDGKPMLERNFNRDSKYEDMRFYLTWRGHFFEKRKIACDCFSHFDFMNHYSEDGGSLNALGEQAFARCLFDYMVKNGMIPPPPKALGGARKHVCTQQTQHVAKGQEGEDSAFFQAAIVNPSLPALSDEVAPFVSPAPPKLQKRSIGCGNPDDAADESRNEGGTSALPCLESASFNDAVFESADKPMKGKPKA